MTLTRDLGIGTMLYGRSADRAAAREGDRATGQGAHGSRNWRWTACLTFRAEGERDGFYQAQLIRELAAQHITSGTGVDLEGGPAPPTPENIAALMELYPVGERLFQEFTLQ